MGGTGWAGAEKGYMSIGPNYWKGEAGRKALIDGSQKLTENQWTDPWRQLLQWVPYTGEGSADRTTEEDLELFASGAAAMYLAGSWDLSQLSDVPFSIGAFSPPVPNDGDQCYIQDHIDMAMAMNAASPNAEAARTFLEWVGSEVFSHLYANALPGFFPLSNFDVEMDSPLQREFISWREKCESTIRPFAQFLDRGPDPTLTTQSFTAFVDIINGQVSPDNVTSSMQTYLEGWYEPQVTERENNHTPADTESSDSSGASGMFHGFTVSLAVTSLQIFGILF
jgi:raffinose/stachyose/melibiose transport system substrate-binding protein